MQRVAHLVLDDPPPILDDPVAARLVGPGAEAHVRERAERYRRQGARALRAHLVVRSRFAEDAFTAAVARGTDQLVVLGAGLDSFACRQPPWAAAADIVEVDHPATQAAKLRRLAAAGITLPGNVALVPADLVMEDLRTALERAGLDPRGPITAACLGVLMYLPPAVSDAVMRAVAAWAPGSELVATFAHPASPIRPDRVARAAEAAGEAWLDRPGPDAMAHRLRAAGFGDVRVVPVQEIADRYFAGRVDLTPPRRPIIAIARS